MSDGSSLTYLGEVRRLTTQVLTAVLGEDQLHERWAEGNAMAYDDGIVYALTQIEVARFADGRKPSAT